MPLSCFTDRNAPPDAAAVREALGKLDSSWRELIRRIEQVCPSLTQTWRFTSKSTGWGMRLMQGDRILVYMTPARGHFLVSFVLGEKAVQAIRRAGVSQRIARVIEESPKYAEGRGVRFKVSSGDEIEGLETIAALKAAN